MCVAFAHSMFNLYNNIVIIYLLCLLLKYIDFQNVVHKYIFLKVQISRLLCWKFC